MKAKKFLCSVLVGASMLCGLAFVGCDTTTEPPVTFDAGSYYFYGEDDALSSFVLTDSTFELVLNGQTITGTFTFDGKKVFTLSTNTALDEPISAIIEDNVISVIIGTKTYACQKGDVYTVTYSDGDSLTSTYVVGGTKAQKPSDPTKSGQIFIGWYEDSAFKTLYNFDSAVSKSVTLYARYVAELENIFTVKFAGASEEIADRQTNKGGVLVDLPTLESKDGAQFLGWWMSDYEDAEKLTAQYTGQVLSQNLTLYAVWDGNAPAVSVGADGVTWNNRGVNASYRVTITPQEGTAVTQTVSTTQLSYNFAAQPAGEYTVEVTVNGQTGTAYYKNKALGRVSLFDVDGFLLQYNAVPNAEKYLVTADCGNEDHSHVATYTNYDNGDKLLFDFELCDMRPEGISFTVQAVADGYLSSVSVPFTFERSLGQVENIQVTDKDTFTWNKVDNATYYVVKIGDNAPVEVYEEESVSVKELTGDIKISVYAYAHGYNSVAATVYTYQKTKLASLAASSITADATTIRWEEVDGAVKYRLNIAGKDYETAGNETSMVLPTEVDLSAKSIAITVTAIAADSANNSLPSDAALFASELSGQLKYENGIASWAGIFGAKKYFVQVNDEAPIEVLNNKTNSELTLTQKGTNVIRLSFENNNGVQSDWEEVEAEAFEITLKNGDKYDSTYGSVYRAVGDPLKLPESEEVMDSGLYLGYTFKYWSDRKDGNRYTVPTLEKAEDLVLYAYGTANTYKVTFVHTGGSMNEDELSVEVTYDSEFIFPTATPNNITRAFAGWYTAEFNGTQITDFDGTGKTVWRIPRDTSLYANWAEIFKFISINNGEAYSVSKGPGISMVTEITIPQVYNNKPVTTVEGNAFDSCSLLKVVNIYDTIENIVTGSPADEDDPMGSAFYNCSKIEAVNILTTEGTHERFYTSVDGVLIKFNKITGNTELRYVPPTKKGVYEIPDIVDTIPKKIFQKVSLEEVTIPATVKHVGEEAFASMYTLTKVTFLSAPEGVEEVSLSIGEKAFSTCTKLKDVVLPSRLEEFNDGIFDRCSALENIDINGEGGKYTSIDGVLFTENGTKLFYCPRYRAGEYTIPSGVTTIAAGAFKDNSKLTKIIIPGNVTLIEGKKEDTKDGPIVTGAFSNCSGLQELIFTGDENDLDLTIQGWAFFACTKIQEVVLPANLKNLEESAFSYCSMLKTVTVTRHNENYNYQAGAFGTTLSYDSFNKKYYEFDRLNYYVLTVNLGADVDALLISEVFGQRIAEVNIDENNQYYTSVEGIMYDKAVTVPVFYPEGREGAYNVPNTVTTIPQNIFRDKTNLQEINISKSVQTIAKEAFLGCKNLRIVTFAADGVLREIGDNAFKGCTSLEAIELPASLEEFKLNVIPGVDGAPDEYEFRVFDGCTNLKSVTVAAGSTHFASYNGVLYSLKEGQYNDLIMSPRANTGVNGVIDIPKTVTSIWYHAFYENREIKKIICSEGFAGNVTVGSEVFYNCVALEEVVLPEGMTKIGKNMFYGCAALEEITIPSTVITWESSALTGCKSLAKITMLDGDTELVFEDGTPATTQPNGSGAPTTISAKGAFVGLTALTEVEFSNRVTAIPSCAFYDCANLEVVKISSTITVIGSYAFFNCSRLAVVEYKGTPSVTEIQEKAFSTSGYSSNPPMSNKLTKIFIPKSVTTIGAQAFYSCYYAEEIEFEEGSALTTIGASAFEKYSDPLGKGITSIKIPASVVTINSSAFKNQKYVSTLTFEKGSRLTTIGNYAFNGLVSLTAVEIPVRVETIGQYAFSGCSKLASITFQTFTAADVEKDAELDETAIGKTSLKTIGIEYKNTEVSTSYTFTGTAISSFTFPESINELYLGACLFSGTKNLTTITLSYSVTSGLERAVNKAMNISSIVIPSNHPAYYGDPDMPILYTTKQDSNGNYVKGDSIMYIYGAWEDAEFIVPAGAERIGDNAFKNQVGLKKVYLPDTLTSIGNAAFIYCMGLEEVFFYRTNVVDGKYVPVLQNGKYVAAQSMQGELTIGENAFAYCVSLSSISLPEGVVEIKKQALTNTGITSLTLPSSVKSLGNSAFAANPQLTEVISYAVLTGTVPNSSSYAVFRNCPLLTTVTFKPGTTKIPNYFFYNYKALTQVTIPEGVTEIGNYAFQNCSEITSITLPSSLTKIGNYAFDGCSLLDNVVIPQAVTSLGTYLFRNCTALSSVTFAGENDKLTKLDNYTFSGCTSLESFTIPASITTLGTNVFEKSGLLSIEIPSSVKSFGNYAFDGCASLSQVTFPNTSLTSLGTYVFRNCTSLESFTIPASITSLGNYSFTGSGLTSIEIPASATTLGTYLFQNCTALETVILPDGATSIGNYTFDGCSSLSFIGTTADKTKQALPSGLETIGTNAFRNCTSLQSITLPATLKGTLGSYAFAGCEVLESVTFKSGIAITKIDSYAFKDCVSLEELSIPASVTTLGTTILAGCTGLTKITFAEDNALTAFVALFSKSEASPFITDGDLEVDLGTNSKMTTVVNSMFAYIPKLKGTLDLSGYTKVTHLGTYFTRDTAVTTVILPDSLKQLGKSATVCTVSDDAHQFYNSPSLTTVVLGNQLTKIGKSAFCGCPNLTTVRIRTGENTYLENNVLTGVTLIGNYAFDGCSSLTSMDISSATTVGTHTFRNCSLLESVVLNDSLTALTDYMFFNNYALKSIKKVSYPENVLTGITTIGNTTFQNCAFETLDVSDVTSVGTWFLSNCRQLSELVGLKVLNVNSLVSCTALTSFTFDASITEIPESAMRYSGFTSIEIPATITSIGASAFYGCEDLVSVDFTNASKLTEIGNYAFSNCGITSVVVPATVTSIGASAFYGCEDLVSVDFTNASKLTEIGNYAFSNCGITNVVVPANLTEIGYGVFSGCTNLEVIDWSANSNFIYTNGVLTTKDNILLMYPSSAEEVALTGYKAIGDHVFDGNEKLTELVLPNNITAIGNYAFANSSLTKITIPATVTYIGSGAFSGSALKEIVFLAAKNAEDKVALTIGASAFEGTNLKSVVIPDNVTSIGAGAFKNCVNLTSVIIPDSVTSISEGIFSGCSALESLTTPFIGASKKTATDLQQYPLGYFFGTEEYEGAYLAEQSYRGDKLTTTVKYAGYLPESLTSVTVTKGDILYGAFQKCTSLTTVVCKGSFEKIQDYAFQNATGLTSVTLPETVKEIGTYAFDGCTALADVELNEGLLTIGNYAFSNSGLTAVTFPASTTSVGSYAFQNCLALVSVDVAAGADEIVFTGTATDTKAGQTFMGCTALETVKIPKAITVMPYRMFMNCTALTNVQFEEGSLLNQIGKEVFSGCTSLAEIELPASLTELGANAFENCYALNRVVLPEGLLTIGTSAFKMTAPAEEEEQPEKLGLQHIDLPSTLTSLGSYAFQGSDLESIVLPSGIVKLDTGLFQNCTKLASVTFTQRTEAVTSNASVFLGCTALEELYWYSNMSPANRIFEGWTAEQTIYMVGISEFETMGVWNGMTGTGTDIIWDGGWKVKCDAKIVWNYELKEE